MKKLIVIAWVVCSTWIVNAQKADVSSLFSEDTPLEIKLAISIKDIKKNTNDSTYLPALFYVRNPSGAWDSIKISVRARGIFRRKTCYFPPIRIKVKKDDAKGTILAGNKNLKLVMPCLNNDGKNVLVVKEFICYKMAEEVTPYAFKTRMASLDFTEPDGKKVKHHQLTAFLIEDDDLVAERHHAKVKEDLNLHPLSLNDTAALQHDLFQLMIANTDWSTTFQHNAKVMLMEPRKYIPLAYDFDMSGFVNPPYAVVNADLGISSVRERLYRGFCRKEETVQFVRRQFIGEESKVMDVLGRYEKDLPPREFTDAKKYLGEFFVMLKDDNQFRRMVIEGCRKK